jgi:hypothetical protein
MRGDLVSISEAWHTEKLLQEAIRAANHRNLQIRLGLELAGEPQDAETAPYGAGVFS